MKAVYIEKFGGTDVLKVGEQPRPIPKANQVLIKVRAAGVNPRDFMVREGTYVFKLAIPRFPVILGSDVAGTVESVGQGVTGFQPGDEVYAMQTALGGFGAYAEYTAVDARAVGRKPGNMSFEEAAAVPCTGQTAWQALTEFGKIRKGQKVLVVGASGSVGSFAVQIAKLFGAKVTGVCSGRNAERVRSMGADRVVDYKKQKFNDVIRGQDIVFDTLGMESLGSVKAVLNKRGIYITTVPGAGHIWDTVRSVLWPWGQRSKIVAVKARGKDLEKLREYIEAGKIRVFIDKVYSLEEVAEAHEYIRTFHTRGKLILKI